MRDDDTQILALSQGLTNLRRRATRQKRNIEISADGWQRWSTTMDEIGCLTQRLVASPALDTANLAEKFQAILWLIEVFESLLDQSDLARLRRSPVNSASSRGRNPVAYGTR